MKKNTSKRSKIIWGILMAGLILFAVYETVFSPSFMMQFLTAGLVLCVLSELLIRFRSLRDSFYILGMGLAIPVVIMYATGDDALASCIRLGVLLSLPLCAVQLPLIWKTRQQDVLSVCAVWVGSLAISFTVLCGFTNTYLFFYGLILILLQISRLLHDRSKAADPAGQRITSRSQKLWKRNLCQGVCICVILGSLITAFGDAYTSKALGFLIRTFGHGPEFLYENEELELTADAAEYFPGAKWYDTGGNLIQAHGGQIQRMPVPGEKGKKDMYVWVGEDKSKGHFGNDVAVYVSEDLHSWEFKGDVLRSVERREDLDEDPYFAALYAEYSDEERDIVYQCINSETVMERPKMLYNARTDKYVIWFHSDDSTEANSYKYDVGMAGIAVSDSPFGPFLFLRRQRLSLCPKDQIDCFPASKGEARDMNLFQDKDGSAYIVYTSENNKTLYISKLDETFTDLSAPPESAVYGVDYLRLFPSAMREAPVLFRGENGRYYLLSSSTTGWMSNQARIWSSDSIFGTWKNEGNPFRGSGNNLSFDTQCTSVFQTESGQWIYYGDRWKQDSLSESRYIWLPLTFEDNLVQITWKDRWK